MSDTSWVEEGAACAEVDGQFGYDSVRFTTIERLTATQVMCASGNRYRREDLGGVGSARHLSLWPTDDQRVRNICAQQTIQNLRVLIDNLLRYAKRSEVDSLAQLNEIERLLAEARATITDPARDA